MIMSNIAEIIYRARSQYSFAELRNGPTCKIASVSGGDFDGPAPRRYYRLLQFNVEHRGAHRSIHRLPATRCKRFPAESSSYPAGVVVASYVSPKFRHYVSSENATIGDDHCQQSQDRNATQLVTAAASLVGRSGRAETKFDAEHRSVVY